MNRALLVYVAAGLASAVITLGTAWCSGSGCVVHLKNGETLYANGCTQAGGMLRLVYPVGEAYIPLGSVSSVTRDGVTLDMFQEEGERHAPQAEPAEAEHAPADEVPSAGQDNMPGGWGVRTGTSRVRGVAPVGGAGRDGIGRVPTSMEAENLVQTAGVLTDEELIERLDKLFPEFKDEDILK